MTNFNGKYFEDDQAFCEYLHNDFSDNFQQNTNKSILNKCDNCHLECILDEVNAQYVCDNCGMCSKFIGEQCNLNVEYSKVVKYYPYKKINHFVNHLRNLQGKKYLSLTKQEIRKIKLYTFTKDYNGVKKALKFLGLGKYYENIHFLLFKLFQIEPIRIHFKIQEKLVAMFAQMQHSFVKYHPALRINFLSYNYVIYKLAMIIDQPEIYKNLRLLVSKKKLVEHEKVFKQICGDLGWTWTPLPKEILNK